MITHTQQRELSAIRASNRAVLKRAAAVQNVFERLEAFAVTVIMDLPPEIAALIPLDCPLPTAADIRHHAEHIVDAVMALTRSELE